MNRYLPLLLIFGSSLASAQAFPPMRAPDPKGWVTKSETEAVPLGVPEPVVSSRGTLDYAFEVEVPPARGAPSLSIRYDSDASAGLAGLGWSLHGLPAIVRVPGDHERARAGLDTGAMAAAVRVLARSSSPDARAALEAIARSPAASPGLRAEIRRALTRG